ncbi:MAG: hypothetical protein WBQ65_24745 [Bryobacteraceae bacterium]
MQQITEDWSAAHAAFRSGVSGILPLLRAWWSGEWARRYAPLAAVGLVLFIGAITASIGAIHARLYGHDIFFLLDNGWRALHGERVHVDYTSAWGPVTFLLMAAGLAVSGGSVATISYVNAFVASVAGLWAAWLAAGRSRTMTVVAFSCFVALLVAPPFALGDPFIGTSHGMVYNRYGYALLTIIMLECFLPPAEDRQTRRRGWIEPILTGCALGLLLFLKASYFLVALPLMGALSLFRAPSGRRALLCASGFLGTVFLFLAYLRFDVSAMWNDLFAAAAARSGSLGLRHRSMDLLTGGMIRAALLGAMTFWHQRSSGPAAAGQPLWRRWCYPLTAVLVVVADTLLIMTNAQLLTYPLTAAFAMVLLVSMKPVPRSSASASSSKGRVFLVITGLLLALPMALVQVLGLGYAFIESRVNPDPPGILRFESPRLHPLILYDVPANDMDRYSNGREYVSSLNDGIRLLAAHTRPDEKIATLDMFNPFAYALGREPIRGGIAAANYRYTLDDRHHPSPCRFFADAAVVMVPKYPASPPIFYDGYRKIYEPALEKEFRFEAESPRWRLYRRAAPQDGSSVSRSRTAGTH